MVLVSRGGGVDGREGGPDAPATGKLHEERVRTRLFRRGEEDEEEGEVRKEQRDGHVDFKRLNE